MANLRSTANELIRPCHERKRLIGRKFFFNYGAVKIIKAEYANNIGISNFFVAGTLQSGQNDPKWRNLSVPRAENQRKPRYDNDFSSRIGQNLPISRKGLGSGEQTY